MNWQIFATALSFGLLSSFHCVGMCGAIAFSLPVQHLPRRQKFAGILLYNAGRLCMYALLGLLFGIMGKQIYAGGFQQWFSVAAGTLILIAAVQSFFKYPVFHLPGFKKIYSLVQMLIVKFISKPSYTSMLLLGAANGLLPCGLVYLAITGALAAGSAANGAMFMFVFGLGTVPALSLLSGFKFFVSLSARNFIKKAMPLFIALTGLLLILRGMGLEIPYVSPVLTSTKDHVISCH